MCVCAKWTCELGHSNWMLVAGHRDRGRERENI